MSEISGKDYARLLDVKIKDVIGERKAERKLLAEAKRQADLKGIKDMRSTIGIDPLQRFPKEIWMKILDELDAEDRGNIWQLHPLFRDLLERNRIRDILFPQILKVKEYQDCLSTNCIYFNTFRLVSKSLRNCFDSLMEEKVKKRVRKYDADSTPHYEDILCPMLDYDEEDDDKRGVLKLETLIKNFNADENPAKRFYQKGLSVHFPDYGMEYAALFEHLKKVAKLLRKIGSQIWHFKFLIEYYVQLDSLSDLYVLFQDMICLMPNLKWLEVLIQPKIINEAGTKNERVKMMSILISQKTLKDHEFPHLAHLERLSLYSGKCGAFHNIYEAILSANPHIKMLDVSDWKKKDFPNYSPILPRHFTQSLQLTSFAVNDDNYWSPTTWRRINPIMNRNWSLQKINLSLCSGPRRKDSLIEMFRGLEQFPTLEKVDLGPLIGFTTGDDNTEELEYLKLPNLKDFKLIMEEPKMDYASNNTYFFFSLQFLLHCKKLEKISWDLSDFNDMELRGQLKKYEWANNGNVVGFRAGLKILYDSNMWKVFPSLNHISVRNKREGADHSCSHEYLRRDAMDGVSYAELLQIHECSRFWLLASCTALLH